MITETFAMKGGRFDAKPDQSSGDCLHGLQVPVGQKWQHHVDLGMVFTKRIPLHHDYSGHNWVCIIQ